MELKSFLKCGVLSKVEARAAAGTTDLVSDVVDMAGFDSVAFFASTGDGTSGTVLELQVFKNTANSVSSPTPVEVTSDDVTYTSTSATDADNKLLCVDIPKWDTNYRYTYATLVIDTQNCECDGIYCYQYNSRDIPVTQNADMIASAIVLP